MNAGAPPFEASGAAPACHEKRGGVLFMFNNARAMKLLSGAEKTPISD
jgi:hypothetical protein